MKDYSDIYKIFQQADEQRKQQNFNAFMNGFEANLIKDLNESYSSGNMEQYEKLLKNIKENGIRVFRDSKDRHKLKFI